MKHICSLVLLATALLINAQTTPNWQWLRGGGSTDRGPTGTIYDTHDYLDGMVLDDSSNVYLAGTIHNESSWSGVNYYFPNYTQSANWIAFVSKYSACGSHVWTKYLHGPTTQHTTFKFKMQNDGNLLWLIQGPASIDYSSKLGSSPTSTDTSFYDVIQKPSSFIVRTIMQMRASDGKLLNMVRRKDDSGKFGLLPMDIVRGHGDNYWALGSGGIDTPIFNNVNMHEKMFFIELDKNFMHGKHYIIADISPKENINTRFNSVKHWNGHLYACGIWKDSINFIDNNTNLIKHVQPNPQLEVYGGFYVHYDSTGKLRNFRVNKGQYGQFQSMDVDDEGNVYLLTHGPDTIPYFDNIRAVTASRDTFVDHLMIVKLDKNDSVIAKNVVRMWLGNPGTGYNPPPTLPQYGVLKVDPKSQEVYVTARITRAAVKVDSTTINRKAPSTINSLETVLIKLDKNLKYEWNKVLENDVTVGSASANRASYPEQLQVDSKGNVVLGGTFTLAMQINDTTKIARPQNANQWIYFARYGYPCGSNLSLIKPVQPALLAAQAQSTSTIQLNWNNGSSNEWGFYVYRSLNANGPFALIDSTNAGVAQYLNTGLQAATKYYYRVTAFNNAGQSDSTNIASATTLNTVGVEEVNTTVAWVYPNPAVGYTQVEISKGFTHATFTLYDMAGSAVKTIALQEGVTTVGLNEIAAGLYHYRIAAAKVVLGRGSLVVGR